MDNDAYIALGTNIEPRFSFIQDALRLLHSNKQMEVLKKSSIYETKPVGYLDQSDFLNMVIQVETILTPMELLHVCQDIEKKLGRKRDIRFGPRTIDLDILLYNQENSTTENLIIPHPRMHERAFVLIPLAEIAPGLHISKWNKNIMDVLHALPESDKRGVTRWSENELGEEGHIES